MARYEKKKPSDFGLGKPTAKEKSRCPEDFKHVSRQAS